MNKPLVTPPQAVLLQGILEALSELLITDTLEANRRSKKKRSWAVLNYRIISDHPSATGSCFGEF
jgi:hypothetical protein